MRDPSRLDRIQIVLVDTQDGANIGSVCRAMKTMGITHLVIVSEREYEENRVRTLALHASDVWENRVHFPTLREALKESSYTVAATRRRGKFRKHTFLSPLQLAEKIAHTEGTISIVFGRESDGLTDEEVAACAQVVSIPTSDEFPSLNLAQAVQIITYTLFEANLPHPTGLIPITQERARKASDAAVDALHEIGYFKLDQEELWTRRFLRDVFTRASLSESEAQRLEKIFTKMVRIKIHKKENPDEQGSPVL